MTSLLEEITNDLGKVCLQYDLSFFFFLIQFYNADTIFQLLNGFLGDFCIEIRSSMYFFKTRLCKLHIKNLLLLSARVCFLLRVTPLQNLSEFYILLSDEYWNFKMSAYHKTFLKFRSKFCFSITKCRVPSEKAKTKNKTTLVDESRC